VQKIMDGMKDDAMAAYSTPAPTPSAPAAHTTAPLRPTAQVCQLPRQGRRPLNEAKPDLKTAYHQQCIGCHTEMGIEKPAATACTNATPRKSNLPARSQ
jgi:hypothetical protein